MLFLGQGFFWEREGAGRDDGGKDFYFSSNVLFLREKFKVLDGKMNIFVK